MRVLCVSRKSAFGEKSASEVTVRRASVIVSSGVCASGLCLKVRHSNALEHTEFESLQPNSVSVTPIGIASRWRTARDRTLGVFVRALRVVSRLWCVWVLGDACGDDGGRRGALIALHVLTPPQTVL